MHLFEFSVVELFLLQFKRDLCTHYGKVYSREVIEAYVKLMDDLFFVYRAISSRNVTSSVPSDCANHDHVSCVTSR